MEDIYDVETMSDDEAESKAYALGWRNQEEYSGDPAKFTDAKSFLKKANDNIPMLRENFKKIDASNRRLQEQLDNMSRQQNELVKRLEDAEKRGYEKAVREIELKQREAVESGDISRFDDLQKQKENLLGQGRVQTPKTEVRSGGNGLSMDDKIAMSLFENENRWFRQDEDLNADMRGFVLAIKSRNPQMAMVEVLEKAKERTIRANPDKFKENSKVNSVLSSGTAASGKMSYAALPAQERDNFDREWAYTEREMRARGVSADKIRQFREEYQKNCLAMFSK